MSDSEPKQDVCRCPKCEVNLFLTHLNGYTYCGTEGCENYGTMFPPDMVDEMLGAKPVPEKSPDDRVRWRLDELVGIEGVLKGATGVGRLETGSAPRLLWTT